MLSRIAESLFWLARYIERAEDTARILDVNYHMLLEQSQQSYRLRWEPLIIMAGEENRFRQCYEEANAENVFDFLAFRQDNPSSIVQCIAKARENARTIRDRISREMWEDINGLYYKISRFNPQDEIAAGPHRFCDEIKFGTHRFHGVTDATMPHDEGWQFLRIAASPLDPLQDARSAHRPASAQRNGTRLLRERSRTPGGPDRPASELRQGRRDF